MAQTISVNVMTRGPGDRVAAALALLRPVADEILVAVDDRADRSVTAALARVADRLVLYPFAEPVDRPIAWLHHECACDWVLTIDDDEIPSASLIDALPDLIQANDSSHYWLPRRWLFPDESRYLDQSPWRPDYELRLVQRDLRLLYFSDETHFPIASLGPGRYLDLPLYHADCVLHGVETREGKARRYERQCPGKRIAGASLNQSYYLPERAPEARTQPVPLSDLALIRRVLNAPATRATPVTDVPAVTRSEIDRLWAGRRFSESAYRARLTLLQEPGVMLAGETSQFDVLVENLGDEMWPWGSHSRPEIRLSYRWHRQGTDHPVEDLRTPLPVDLRPKDSCIVPASVMAPSEPGEYELELDLVHEHVRWFGCSLVRSVTVNPCRRIAVLANGSPPVEALEWLAEAEPDAEPLLFSGDSSVLAEAYAGTVVPGPEPYLLEGLPRGRLRSAPILAIRTAGMLAAARRLRRGKACRPFAPSAQEFLEALAGTERLVIPDGDGTPRLLRQRFVPFAAGLAARALGVKVVREP